MDFLHMGLVDTIEAYILEHKSNIQHQEFALDFYQQYRYFSLNVWW